MARLRHAILCESILADGDGLASIVNIVRELGEHSLPWESAFFWVFWIDDVTLNEEVTVCTDVLFRGARQISAHTTVAVRPSGTGEGFFRIGPVVFSEAGDYIFRIGIRDVPNPFEWKAQLTRSGPAATSRNLHLELL